MWIKIIHKEKNKQQKEELSMSRIAKRIKKNKEVFMALHGGREFGGKVVRSDGTRKKGIG